MMLDDGGGGLFLPAAVFSCWQLAFLAGRYWRAKTAYNTQYLSKSWVFRGFSVPQYPFGAKMQEKLGIGVQKTSPIPADTTFLTFPSDSHFRHNIFKISKRFTFPT